ncbi:mono/diheme cytochrome c family protein [Pseudoxanthomonas japonensis]|uniref:c-type cytochrome n=1 Tax=Pseudoxanthomonas japonensis TaxID=69284 RepID=UPI002865C225|nr:DUF3471 domain-containing protein [Pseudoxanthomonas japonensis]MDR7067844.1 mono/diheme cytochrome c family protein [Pseudoxanthomonas japonensis]
MRLTSYVRTVLTGGCLLLIAACGEHATPAPTPRPALPTIAQQPPLPGLRIRPLTDRTFERTEARRERGRYLADGILQCALCHSDRDWGQPGAPPVQSRTLAGHVWKDEGTTRLVAPNLTSDVETGVGGWSDDMLARAIREGISHDGRPLHPQMWYPSFSMLSDEDLASVIVYLRSLPAIRNPLPRTQLSDEQVQRIVGRPMPITTPVPGPVDDSPLERGRYLAAIGDCGGCHTLWEAKRLPGAFAGGNAISRDGKDIYSTNLTPHATGIDYDAAAFVQLMRTGKQGLTHPMMPWAAFRHLTDEDLRALHAFLQTRHPVAHAISNLAPPTMCAVCGQTHGLGDINQRVKPKGVTVPEATLRDYVGTYRVERYDWTLRITLEHGRLHAKSADGPPADLVPLDDTLFAMDGGLGPLRFRRAANGKVDAVVSKDVDDVVLARISDTTAPAP